MSLASRIAATSRRPTATVRLGGARWRDVLTLSRDQQFGQGISSGEVIGRNPPVAIVEGETTISWAWGYDGYETQGFSGIVTKVVQRSYPNQVRLQVADLLWLADIQRKDIATDPLNSIAASTAMTQILSGAGLTRLAIPALPASGSAWAGAEWVLGTLTPVSFPNTTALAAAQAIGEPLGYWLSCDASGIVRAALIERRPSESPFRTLRWGVDFLLASPPERERDAATVKNRVVVKGANTGVQGAQIKDAWQTGAADRTLEYSSSLIEYVNESEAGAASCTGVAKRMLLLWSRPPNVIRIGRLKADPRLAVGMTLAIVCSLIGYSSPTPFFIYGLATTLDLRSGDFSQSLTLDGGVGDQGYTTMPPPEASFIWRLVRETLNGVAVVEVFLDGTGSHSLGAGEIVSWTWTTSTAVLAGTPDTATGPHAMFLYPATTTTAEITLTVMDTSSKTGTITQPVPLAGDATATPTTRVISVALGAAWAATPDSGAAWRVEATGDSTLVPEQGGPDGLLSTRGTGSTGLRQSTDVLASASTSLAALGGQITALSCTPDTTRVWAAVGTALYRSIDDGATFSLWGTLPATIAAVLEDPAVPSSVFCLAGPHMYHSTLETPGAAWVVLYEGPAGATARHLVRGQSGATTWICYTGSFVGSPLQRVEGPVTAVWPLGTAPDVAEIRAIALSDDETTVYAWDGQGRAWVVDSATGVATASTAALGAGETAQHALMDPDDPIVYLATFGSVQGSVYKYFPLADQLSRFYQPAAGQQAHRIGLGAPAVAPIRLLIPSVADGRRGVWELALAGGWTLHTSGLPALAWSGVAVDPTYPQRWLLWYVGGAVVSGVVRQSGVSPLWITSDAGATWESIALTMPGVADGVQVSLRVIWSAQGGAWRAFTDDGGYGTPRLWRGVGAVADAPITPTGYESRIGWNIGTTPRYDALASGRDGDTLIWGFHWRERIAGSIPGGGGAYTIPGGAAAIGVMGLSGLARLSGYAAAATVWDGTSYQLWATPDYRTTAPSLIGPVAARDLAATADGDLYGSGATDAGIVRIPDPLTSSASEVVYAAGETVGRIRAHGAALAAWKISGGATSLYVYHAGSWQTVAGPATAGELMDWVEIAEES